MWKLMGKFKNKEWEEIDNDTSNDPAIRASLLKEYANTAEQGWMFKWELI